MGNLFFLLKKKGKGEELNTSKLLYIKKAFLLFWIWSKNRKTFKGLKLFGLIFPNKDLGAFNANAHYNLP